MTDFGDKFLEEISILNPRTNVNDENANLPHAELLHNQKFLLNVLNGTSSNNAQLLSLIYGNLMDYDSSGNKVFFNGGNFDCFEKKHSWLAINDGNVVNDTDIQTEGAANLLVYKGGTTYSDENGDHGVWLERDFFIPTQLRGSELIFAIKGTGVYLNSLVPDVPFDYEIPYCDDSEVPNIYTVGTPGCLTPSNPPITGDPYACDSGFPPPVTPPPSSSVPVTGSPDDGTCEADLSNNCFARYEDVGIEIVGATEETQIVEVLGPWPHHDLYAKQDDWLPGYRTSIVRFRVGAGTETIKIRIRRTRSDGALALSQAFLGGLPMPYDDYKINNLDINEFYDYANGITKWNTTTVSGHHVGESCGNVKLPDLLTKRDWLCQSQFVKNVEQFDWDEENGPRENELEFSSDVPFSEPATHGMEFDPRFTRYAHFDMRVDGPNPGLAYLGVTYTVGENEFSDGNLCSDGLNPDDICGHVKFDVWTKVVNTNEFANPSRIDYVRFGYNIPITFAQVYGGLGYLEVYGDFYQDLNDSRGALVYFTISRDGESADDTFNGNFTVVGTKIGLAVPPDDRPEPDTHDKLFIGDIEDCIV